MTDRPSNARYWIAWPRPPISSGSAIPTWRRLADELRAETIWSVEPDRWGISARALGIRASFRGSRMDGGDPCRSSDTGRADKLIWDVRPTSLPHAAPRTVLNRGGLRAAMGTTSGKKDGAVGASTKRTRISPMNRSGGHIPFYKYFAATRLCVGSATWAGLRHGPMATRSR